MTPSARIPSRKLAGRERHVLPCMSTYNRYSRLGGLTNVQHYNVAVSTKRHSTLIVVHWSPLLFPSPLQVALVFRFQCLVPSYALQELLPAREPADWQPEGGFVRTTMCDLAPQTGRSHPQAAAAGSSG